jgi:hypothetical protein
MANRRSLSVTSGRTTVHFNKGNLGFNPADTHRNFQICVEDLGGGTYTVSYTPVDSGMQVEFQAGSSETDAIVSSQSVDILYSDIRVSFVNLGVGADPIVHATFWPRGL